MTTYWTKFALSIVLIVAALYVILSKKYEDDAETKKWAFSTITLVAGVWIGTITDNE